MGIREPVSRKDQVGLLATILGPVLLEDHPFPWRIESENEVHKIFDKNNNLVMPFDRRIHAERFIAFNDPASDEALKESMYEADNAHFQSNWVEQNGGLAALLYGVPRLRR